MPVNPVDPTNERVSANLLQQIKSGADKVIRAFGPHKRLAVTTEAPDQPIQEPPVEKKVASERHVLFLQILVQRDFITFDDGTTQESFTTQTVARKGTKPDRTETGDDEPTGRVRGVISGATSFTALMQNLTGALVKGHNDGDLNLLTDNCLAQGTTYDQDNEREQANAPVPTADGPVIPRPQAEVMEATKKETKTKFVKKY